MEIDKFSAAHQALDGVGWTEIFMREDSPQKLADLGITLDVFRTSMRQYLPEVVCVYTGYGSHSELCKNTIGYGYGADCIVYADWNGKKIINHIGTGLFTSQEENLTNAVEALQNFGQRVPLLYVDWAWSFVTPLDQSNTLKEKLELKIAKIARRMEESD